MPTTDTKTAPQSWLFSPFPDLILGCGLGYAFIFLLHGVVGEQMRVWFPPGLMPLLILISGVPHYGATLLRVYERREDRHAYALFAVVLTAVIWAIFAFGLRSLIVGSWFITVYFTWSPWHYAGQNYGIGLMFLRRRGIEVTSLAKRLIWASFTLSYVLSMLALHGELPGGNYAPVLYEDSVYEIIRLGIPLAALNVLVPLVGLAYLGALVGAGFLLLKKATPKDLMPTALLAGSQALWFSIPMLARYTGVFQGVEPLSYEQSGYIFLWVGIAHSVQYLWITTYFAGRQDSTSKHAPYLLRTLLAGAAIWVIPTYIFAPGALGKVPYDAGLALMVAAAVNIHHFVLDGVIWKLRHRSIAKILIRDQSSAPIAPKSGFKWLRPLLMILGVASVLVWVWETLELEGYRRALERRDIPRVEQAATRLERISRGSAAVRMGAAQLLTEVGQVDRAIAHVETALTHRESAKSWATLGALCQTAGRPEEAIRACREALRLDPSSAGAMNNLALYLALNRWGEPEAAREAAELAQKAIRLTESPTGKPTELYAKSLNTLALAYASAGHLEEAWQTANQAMADAKKIGSPTLVAAVQRTLDMFEVAPAAGSG